MSFEAKVILDSISPTGVRLTTIVATFPRFILAEMNTHRAFSRNTASSRAIPVEKMIQSVRENPFIPESWPKNKPGMQATELFSGLMCESNRSQWVNARDSALVWAESLSYGGVHKQIVNRLLEPFSWTTQIITATEWDNFFKLRCHPDAQPEMQKIAGLIRDARDASTPCQARYGEWHMPFYDPESEVFVGVDQERQVAVARCARVSYLTHEGKRDVQKDLELYEKLLTSGHWSPFEHIAIPMRPDFSGAAPYSNFYGWHQFRKDFPQESGE
jgi:thymidylate synthase ThyX